MTLLATYLYGLVFGTGLACGIWLVISLHDFAADFRRGWARARGRA